MISRYLLISLIFTLSGCDTPPAEQGKSQKKSPAIVVESASVQRGTIAHTIERNGSLRAQHEVHLSVQQEGILLELPYHEGDRVEQGAVLARLDDTLLQAQLKKARAQRRQAEQDLKRLRRLQSSRVVAEDELARAVTALDVARAEEEELTVLLQQTRILAPFNGIISARLAEPGDALSRFSHILTLIDDQKLYTELHLSEVYLSAIQLGDQVSLTIDALGPVRFHGTIERIHPVIDESSRMGTIEVSLSPVPAGARPGQLCRVQLQLQHQNRLLAPYNALRRDNRGEFIYVIGAQNRVERRAVISGIHFGEQIEILDGLHPGEAIVTRGFLGLSEGSQVKQVPPSSQP